MFFFLEYFPIGDLSHVFIRRDFFRASVPTLARKRFSCNFRPTKYLRWPCRLYATLPGRNGYRDNIRISYPWNVSKRFRNDDFNNSRAKSCQSASSYDTASRARRHAAERLKHDATAVVLKKYK